MSRAQLPPEAFDARVSDANTSGARAGGAIASGAIANSSQPQKTPRARACHAAAYAPALGGTAVFGGARVCGRDVLTDDTLWLWNGLQWSVLATGGPSAREDALLVFDSKRNVLVLYGGRRDGGIFMDTWEWSRATSWRKIESTMNPGMIEHASMAFDSTLGRVVLFGGAEGREFRDATWEWNGTVWNRVRPSPYPAARIGHSMIWDPASQSVMLYGGFSAAKQLRDLWRWKGQRWTRVDSAGPTYTEGSSLAPGKSALTVIGPGLLEAKTASVWTFEMGKWKIVQAAQRPDVLVGAAVTYDAKRGRYVLTGGGETAEPGIRVVEFDGVAWSAMR